MDAFTTDGHASKLLMSVYHFMSFIPGNEEEERLTVRAMGSVVDPRELKFDEPSWRFQGSRGIQFRRVSENVQLSHAPNPPAHPTESVAFWIENKEVPELAVFVCRRTFQICNSAFKSLIADEESDHSFMAWKDDDCRQVKKQLRDAFSLAGSSRTVSMCLIEDVTRFHAADDDSGNTGRASMSGSIHELAEECWSIDREERGKRVVMSAQNVAYMIAVVQMYDACQDAALLNVREWIGGRSPSKKPWKVKRRYFAVHIFFLDLLREIGVDGPVSESVKSLFARGGSSVSDRHRSVVELMNEGAAIESLESAWKSKQGLWVLSIVTSICAFAGIMQAVDRPESPLPLFSLASWLRLAMIATLGIVAIGIWRLGNQDRRRL